MKTDDMCDYFVKYIYVYVQVVGGRIIKTGDMYDYFMKYMEIFSGDSLPEPKESNFQF